MRRSCWQRIITRFWYNCLYGIFFIGPDCFNYVPQFPCLKSCISLHRPVRVLVTSRSSSLHFISATTDAYVLRTINTHVAKRSQPVYPRTYFRVALCLQTREVKESYIDFNHQSSCLLLRRRGYRDAALALTCPSTSLKSKLVRSARKKRKASIFAS